MGRLFTRTLASDRFSQYKALLDSELDSTFESQHLRHCHEHLGGHRSIQLVAASACTHKPSALPAVSTVPNLTQRARSAVQQTLDL